MNLENSILRSTIGSTVFNSLFRGRKRTHSESSSQSMDENDEHYDPGMPSKNGLGLARNSFRSTESMDDVSPLILTSTGARISSKSSGGGNGNEGPPFLQAVVRHGSSGSGNSSGGFLRGITRSNQSNQHYDIQRLYSAVPFLSNSLDPSMKEKDLFVNESLDQSYSSTAKKQEEDFFPDDAKEGLLNVRATTLLLLWYFFSFCTLFLNKYILSFLQGEPTLLGAVQMVSTTCFGFIQMYIPCGLYRRVERKGQPARFWTNMALVGSMRFSTVVLGLFALKYISVSFTETVKSTAPIFTVVIAWFILRERCGLYVLSSLLPVMGGLALCSAYELSFHLIGFSAAVGTNLMDCLQNVFSKLMISGDDYKYTPAELQFYTSVASIVVQIPASFFVMDFYHAQQDLHSGRMFAALVTNGLCFHLQSITAYALMGYISPITHSVANTAKRAILIWLSVLVFGNDVTLMSAVGTAMVLVGVLLYNKARDYELQRQRRKEHFLAIAKDGPIHHRIL